MNLDQILTAEERNQLRKKLRELPKSELWHLCRVLCPESMGNLIKPDKTSYISKLMVYGLKNPEAPNHLPTIED